MLEPWRAYPWRSLKAGLSETFQLRGPLSPAEDVLVGVAALFTMFWTVANLALVVIVVLVMTLDIMVEVGRDYRLTKKRVQMARQNVADPTAQELETMLRQERGAHFVGEGIGKLMKMAVVVVASLVDLVFAATFPDSSGALMRDWTPLTKASLVWLFVWEAKDVLANVRASEGDQAVPSVLMRSLDRLVLGKEPPVRRHYDKRALDNNIEP